MDRTAKTILKNMSSHKKEAEFICVFDEAWKGYGDVTIDEFAKSVGLQTETVAVAVRYLEEAGYLEYQKSSSGYIGFHLSHKGLNWRYFRRKEILDYIADKWVDFFSMLIALSSLVISIVALLQAAK